MGELESAVMAQLWATEGPLTVREVHQGLLPGRQLAYTTVMTVLDRLAKKDMVTQQRDGRAFRYTANQTREQLTADLMLDALQDTADPAGRAAALQHFVGRVSPGEAAAIRAALDGNN